MFWSLLSFTATCLLLLVLMSSTVSGQDDDIVIQLNHVFPRYDNNMDASDEVQSSDGNNKRRGRRTVTSISRDGSVVAIGSVVIREEDTTTTTTNCNDDDGGRVIVWIKSLDDNWIPQNFLRGESGICDDAGKRVVLSSDGSVLAVVRNTEIQVFNLLTNEIVGTYPNTAANNLFAMSGCNNDNDNDNNNDCVVVLSDNTTPDGGIQIYTTTTDEEVSEIATTAVVSSLAVSENGHIVAVAGGEIVLFYIRDTAANWIQLGNISTTAAVVQLELSAGGMVVAILTGNGTVRVYRYDSDANWIQQGSDLNVAAATSFSLSSDGQRIALGTTGSLVIFIYNNKNNNEDWNMLAPRTEEEEDGSGLGISMSSDGRYVTTGGEFGGSDNAAYLYLIDRIITEAPTVLPTTSPTSPIQLPTSIPTVTNSPTTPFPTSVPTQTPTAMTMNNSTEDDEEVTAPPPPTFCFSSQNHVELIDGTHKQMNELQIGDVVLVDNNNNNNNNNEDDTKKLYEPIYAWGHYHTSQHASFIQFLPSKIELSSNHLVFITTNDDKHHIRAVPAGTVKVGDLLYPSKQQVTSININRNRTDGVYAPFTPSGKIMIVNTHYYTMASTYVSLQYNDNDDDNDTNGDTFYLGKSYSTGISHQWLAHAFQTPHRLYYHYTTKKGTHNNNNNNNNTTTGISTWVELPLQFFMQLLSSSIPIQVLVLFPILIVMMILLVLEQCSTIIILLLLLAIIVHKTTQTEKRKTKN